MPIKIKLDTTICCEEGGKSDCPRIDDCPTNAIYWNGDKLDIDYEKCDNCGSCFIAIGKEDVNCGSIVLEVDGKEFRYMKPYECNSE